MKKVGAGIMALSMTLGSMPAWAQEVERFPTEEIRGKRTKEDEGAVGPIIWSRPGGGGGGGLPGAPKTPTQTPEEKKKACDADHAADMGAADRSLTNDLEVCKANAIEEARNWYNGPFWQGRYNGCVASANNAFQSRVDMARNKHTACIARS